MPLTGKFWGKEEHLIFVISLSQFYCELYVCLLDFRPALCLIQAAASKMDFPVHKNYEILAGWILKTLGDHVGFGVKYIVNPTFMYRNVSASSSDHFLEELKGDLLVGLLMP